jgi:hypothetical protein
MKTSTFILFFYILFYQSGLLAQNTDSLELKTRPFQLTLITPLGTNGMEAGKIKNLFSINIIAGYNGGVAGLELGGFANNIRYDMNGLQLAGFSNIVAGKSNGCQLSGFSNINRKFFKGIQLSGFSNIISDSAEIVQGAGFSNIVRGNATGTQVSGFSNIITGNAIVTQLAGFSNIVRGNTMGIQVSGFSNVTKGNTKGAQIAGFINTNTRNLYGAQISGFINYTRKLNGLQLGVLNICDTIEKGIPIGVISLVKNGYKALEIGSDETMYMNLSFITGVKQFYNIISVGARPGGRNFYWSYGYGIGSSFQLNKSFDLNIELSCHHILVDDWYLEDLNLVNKAKINLAYNLSDHLNIFGGISFNVFVTDKTDAEGIFTDSGLVPWSNYSKEYRNCLVKMYPGINLGIRIF